MDAELTTWLMVFLRVSAMLAIFPVFSAANVPVQLRLALGALVAVLLAPLLPPVAVTGLNLWALLGAMAMEVGIGLLLGFVSRMIFYAVDMAGAIIAAEMGLSLPSVLNPMADSMANAPGLILNYLAAVLWLSLDLHHWMLLGFQRTYRLLPVGGAHLPEALLTDILARTGQTFLIAVQMTAPVIAVSFLITLVFSLLGRAVPQMNVFAESFSVRALAGLAVFGLTLNLAAQHILNYLRRLPEDFLRVAQLLGVG